MKYHSTSLKSNVTPLLFFAYFRKAHNASSASNLKHGGIYCVNQVNRWVLSLDMIGYGLGSANFGRLFSYNRGFGSVFINLYFTNVQFVNTL